jgi:hypothetical protein
MPDSNQLVREIETRIRRLEGVIRNFKEGRRRLEQLHHSSEGETRSLIDQALTVNQGAIDARQRDLELEKARLLVARSTLSNPPPAIHDS